MVSRIALTSGFDYERLDAELAALTRHDRRFGLVLMVDGLCLDDWRRQLRSVRGLPGGRARFGTWCRGVAYVFESHSMAGARGHLYEAPFIWGTDVFVADTLQDASDWIVARLRDHAGHRVRRPQGSRRLARTTPM
jgi:hypothetical protein